MGKERKRDLSRSRTSVPRRVEEAKPASRQDRLQREYLARAVFLDLVEAFHQGKADAWDNYTDIAETAFYAADAFWEYAAQKAARRG